MMVDQKCVESEIFGKHDGGNPGGQLVRLIHRSDHAENASRSDTGLGLPIIDQIMRAHGGAVATDTGARELRLQLPDPDR